MNELKINGKAYPIAESMNELTAKQAGYYQKDVFPDIEASFTRDKKGKYYLSDPEMYKKAQARMLLLLLHFDQNAWEMMYKLQSVPGDDGEDLYYNGAQFFIDEQKALDFLLKDNLTKNLWPSLTFKKRFSKRVLLGPDDEFKNIRIEEYFYADRVFFKYIETKDIHFLHTLISLLYRPQKANLNTKAEDYDGDPREQFNPFTIGDRAALAKTLDQETVYGIYLWFKGCRQMLTDEFPLLYRGTTTQGPKLKNQEELVLLCGGAEKYNVNRHMKLMHLMYELHAKEKQSIRK